MALNRLRAILHITKYVEASILISLGGGIFGYDFLSISPRANVNNISRLDTGTIGPITAMPQFAVSFGTLSATVHGLVVSTILIPAAIS